MITGSDDFGFGGSGSSMVDQMKTTLREAVEDEDVKAIVLRINSPGGEVTASDTIYNEVRMANQKKPVVVYMDSVAASGGYYVACGAEEIIANETTLTGSIGVIIQTLNYRELFGKVGLESLVFKSGEFKDLLSSTREMSVDEKAMVQEMVMEIYEKFLGIVAESRELPADQLRIGIADGRVFSGAKAKEAGLIDATGYIEDAYERARKLAGAPDAPVYRIRSSVGFFEAIGLAEGSGEKPKSESGRLEIDISDRIWPRLQPGMIYLLPTAFSR
jgi:protease-4